MFIVNILASIAYGALLTYLLVMWARFILDVVRAINRRWRPQGFLLVVSELVYLITDPPIRLARRIIPPMRVGGMGLDFAWSIVMLCVVVLIILTASLR